MTSHRVRESRDPKDHHLILLFDLEDGRLLAIAIYLAAIAVVALKISDPATGETGYDDISSEHKREPYPNVEGLRVFQRIIKTQSPEVAHVRVVELVDDRIVRKLDANGFIAKAYDYSPERPAPSKMQVGQPQ